jgi:hypothetical protein
MSLLVRSIWFHRIYICLKIPNPAFMWHSKTQLGQRVLCCCQLFIWTPNVKAWNRKLEAVRVRISMTSGGNNCQVISTHNAEQLAMFLTNMLTVSRCCFEADSTEQWCKGSSSHSNCTEPTTGNHPLVTWIQSATSHPISLISVLISSSHMCLVLTSSPSISDFQTKILYAFLIPPMCDTCPTHSILLNVITLIIIIIDEQYKLRSCLLCNFLNHPITPSLLYLWIFLVNGWHLLEKKYFDE